MLIFTDSIDFANKYFPEITEWKPLDLTKIDQNILHLIQNLISFKDIYFFDYHSNTDWHSLILVEKAENSQYDVLLESLNNNINLPDKILCFAGSGENFHGFHSRKWLALEGNIHLTVYLKPNVEIKNNYLSFLLLSVISVIETLDSINTLNEKAYIKWINDIYIDSTKVSGVLAQTHIQGSKITDAVLGVGLNVETTPTQVTDEFIPNAASLNDFLQNENQLKNNDVLFKLIENIECNYKKILNGDSNKLIEEYLSKCNIIGRQAVVYSDEFSQNLKIIAKGKIKNIGENLELYIENFPEPITNGRLVLK